MRPILISDFDGTITRRDFYLVLDDCRVPASAPDYFAQYVAGQLTHFDVMNAYLAYTPEDEAEADALLRRCEPDPAMGAAAARLDAAGWDLMIVSAGCSWYIDRVLGAAGVRAIVHANPGRIVPGRGLVMEHPRDTPFPSANLGIDKAAVVRDALSRASVVAFAGDGLPDLSAALLVNPDLRFARGNLAQELTRRGERFRSFNRWSEVVDRLLG